MDLYHIKLTRSTFLFLGITLALVALIFSSVAAECPKCYTNNDTPMAGHGPAPDGSGRRTIQIKIDASWGAQTNPAIWNGVDDAADAWNDATDGANPPNKTGYFFKIDQA